MLFAKLEQIEKEVKDKTGNKKIVVFERVAFL